MVVLKVARVLIIALTSNLECVFRIESQQVQGHFKVNGVFLGGWASNLGLMITMECQTSSRSSQGHWGIYYWIVLKLTTCDHNGVANKVKVISRSLGHLLLDCPQT